jgi:hypothetical protein
MDLLPVLPSSRELVCLIANGPSILGPKGIMKSLTNGKQMLRVAGAHAAGIKCRKAARIKLEVLSTVTAARILGTDWQDKAAQQMHLSLLNKCRQLTCVFLWQDDARADEDADLCLVSMGMETCGTVSSYCSRHIAQDDC